MESFNYTANYVRLKSNWLPITHKTTVLQSSLYLKYTYIHSPTQKLNNFCEIREFHYICNILDNGLLFCYRYINQVQDVI